MVEHHLAKVGVAGSNPVFRSIIHSAGVAELADAQDLKSCGERSPYRFDSGPRHHLNKAPVAQLDRAFDYGSRGYGFDSYRARHFIMIINYIREVAQLGRALGLGPRGRRFESCLPDFF